MSVSVSTPPKNDAGSVPPDPWPVAQRVAFRFICSYAVLYLVLERLLQSDLQFQWEAGLAPGAGPLLAAYARIWAPVVVWTANHVLHIARPLVFRPDGNSDGIYGYVELFCVAALGCIATVLWSVADRKRTDYRRLFAWLKICARYALAFSMLSYGMLKVLRVQFSTPDLTDLLVPLGWSSPFALFRNFMGYSALYTIFAGMGEVVAGVLLFFRRTSTLGALIAIAVMVNVVVLNFGYDWPEKLDAIHLVLLAVLIVAADANRLLNVLVRNRLAMPANLDVPLIMPSHHVARTCIKSAVIAYFGICAMLYPMWIVRTYGSRSPLYGIYDVQQFTRNGHSLPPLTTDSVRWKQVVIEGPHQLWLVMTNDDWHNYRINYDSTTLALTIFTGQKPTTPNALSFTPSGPGEFTLRGVFVQDTLVVTLKRFDETTFNLLSRRFRWVNGQP